MSSTATFMAVYLVGKTDDETIKRIQDISRMSEAERSHVYALLDAFITKNEDSGNIVNLFNHKTLAQPSVKFKKLFKVTSE